MGLHQYHMTEEIDPLTGLFFLSLHKKKSKGMMSKEEEWDYSHSYNMAIYDPKTDQTRYLFDNPYEDDAITHILYETGYNGASGKVVFNRSSSRIVNTQFAQREPSSKILVCQRIKAQNTFKIWLFDKNTASSQLIAALDDNSSWVLDVKNQKVIAYKRELKGVDFKAFDF
ncbi:MAG: hypothetical protein AAFU33_19240 [Bacteroidota bacterium]